MRMNALIPMQAQGVDVAGSMMRGAQAGQFINDGRHQNALRGAISQHGAGLVAGDDDARNALAGYDPGMVMQADAHRQGMDHNERKLELAYRQANQQAMQFSAQMSAVERQRTLEETERALAAATTAQDPESWDRIMSQFGEEGAQFIGQFERRQELFAAARGFTDALRASEPQGPQSPEGKFFADQAAGLVPEGAQMRSGVTVNTGDQGPRTGTIPPGMMLIDDPEAPGGLRMVPIAGGPVEQEAIQGEEQAFRRDQQRARAGSTVIQDLQRGLDLLPELGAIARGEGVVGGLTRAGQSQLPSTVAGQITAFTESALSNVGLDTLQQMRENSPTGGALGQVPIQQQRRLEQVLGSLDIKQPPSVLEANIKRVMNIYTDIIYGTEAERARAVQQGRMSPEQSAEIDGFYYELPFDERGRPVDQGRERQPARATTQTIQQMSVDDLLSLDVMSLDEAGLEAFERRLQEFGR